MSGHWTEKYKACRLSEILGQPGAIRELVAWGNSWKRGGPYKKVALLYGPPGTGKSTAAWALARDFGWDFLEMNASDQRTMSEIKRVVGTAATTGTLFGARGALRLIVVDEADRIHGTLDRGGYQALMEVVKTTSNPIILIANDPYEIPWELRIACQQINFRRLSDESILLGLQRICSHEGISADPSALRVIAETARGDMRAAINDLEAMAIGKRTLKPSDLALNRRDVERNVFEFLKVLLSAREAKDARGLIWSLDMPPDDVLAWISENVPKIVSNPTDRTKVYDVLSRADMFLNRAKKRQDYRFWGYASDLMSSGVSAFKGEDLKWSKFESPSHIKRFARTRRERAVLTSLSRKIASFCHASSRTVRNNILPYLRLIAGRSRKFTKSLKERLDLTDAEMKLLTG